MASKIKIEKDIFVRDGFGVRRRAWIAGDLVEPHVYNAVLRTNKVVNGEDLPVQPNTESTPTLNTSSVQNKELPEPEPTPDKEVDTEESVVEVKPKTKKVVKKKASKKVPTTKS